MAKGEKMILNMDEVAEALGICRASAYRLARQAGFPAITLCGRMVVPISALDKWLEDQERVSASIAQAQ